MEYKNIKVNGETLGVSECGSLLRISKGGRWRKAGEYVSSGRERRDGYWVVTVKGQPQYVHRMVAEAWLGGVPAGMQVHHVDGDRSNNTVGNLRIMSAEDHQAETSRGTSSGFFGVSWQKAARKWEAHFKFLGTKHYLGLFDTETEAAKAHDVATMEKNPDPRFLNTMFL